MTLVHSRMYCAVPSCPVVREDRMDYSNYNRWSSVHSGTFYLVQWYMKMRCTLYQADYPMVHNRAEAKSRTFWDILGHFGMVWTFVGNPGHVWRLYWQLSKRGLWSYYCLFVCFFLCFFCAFLFVCLFFFTYEHNCTTSGRKW